MKTGLLTSRPLRGVAATLLVLLGVLLTDAAVATVAMLSMMGDTPDGNYSTSYRVVVCILATYLLFLLGLGLYWHKQRQNARLVGVLLGSVPIGWLLLRFLFQAKP